MKIIAVTPFHLRPHISEIFWLNCNEIGLPVVAITSDLANRRLADQYALKHIQAPNNPLGNKWQTGINHLKNIDFDYCLIIGSDDLTSHKCIDLYKKIINDTGAEYIGFEDALAMDFKTKKFRHFKGYQGARFGESIGANRLVSKRLLELINYDVFPIRQHKYMDKTLTNNLKKQGIENVLIKQGLKPYRFGIKTGLTLSKVYPNSPFIYKVNLQGWFSDQVINLLNQK